MGALDLAADAAQRAAERGPADSSSWARLGRLRLQLMDRDGAIEALERARVTGPTWKRCSIWPWPTTWPVR